MDVSRIKCIVVGTGRCGTVYYARLLNSLGISCGHESFFTNLGLEEALDRIANRREIKHSNVSMDKWQMPDGDLLEADSSYMAVPYIRFFPEAKIIHLVRNPRDVINSFVSGLGYFRSKLPLWDGGKIGLIDDNFHRFIYRYLPELTEDMDPLTRAALYYIRWNEIIESQVIDGNYLRHRIEDGPEAVLKFMGLKSTPDMYEDVTANKSNRRPQFDDGIYSISPHVLNTLQLVAARYGYNMNPRKVYM